MIAQVVLETKLEETARAAMVRGMFDLEKQTHARSDLTHSLPLENKEWQIGLITGPSGCGKSTLARALWPESFKPPAPWPEGKSLLDAFPVSLGIKEIVELLSSVGFSSPPAWLRPFETLSTGQQFRATLARLLASALAGAAPTPLVCDEFTSVVDRVVARIGSAALARVVRKSPLKFVACSCHADVIDWLQPDWVYYPGEQRFDWRCLQRRPGIELEIHRTGRQDWTLFAPHHYLSHSLNPSAVCFLARWQGQPVAFSAWLPFVGAGPLARREHRTVCLPDFQGVGIGQALSNFIASLWKGLGYRALSTTTHPGLIASRNRAGPWRLRRAPSLARGNSPLGHATTRLTAGFEYLGPALSPREARELLLAR
ncbi:MAG: ABC transporter ATP-binding protein [Gemmataceae bacterium]|nr:ABC transporter ATP-binding protein [Gemmataceae bacterium]